MGISEIEKSVLRDLYNMEYLQGVEPSLDNYKQLELDVYEFSKKLFWYVKKLKKEGYITYIDSKTLLTGGVIDPKYNHNILMVLWRNIELTEKGKTIVEMKEGEEKILSKKEDNKDYDVTLSFAGEDRKYVDHVATILQSLSIKVFYDKFEEVELWGKDLYTYLDDIYQNKAKYCVMFISKAYKEKRWTNHERESAQARAFEEMKEYILPARFDDTVIPGVKSTTGYIDLRDKSPEDFAYIIAKKVCP